MAYIQFNIKSPLIFSFCLSCRIHSLFFSSCFSLNCYHYYETFFSVFLHIFILSHLLLLFFEHSILSWEMRKSKKIKNNKNENVFEHAIQLIMHICTMENLFIQKNVYIFLWAKLLFILWQFSEISNDCHVSDLWHDIYLHK